MLDQWYYLCLPFYVVTVCFICFPCFFCNAWLRFQNTFYSALFYITNGSFKLPFTLRKLLISFTSIFTGRVVKMLLASYRYSYAYHFGSNPPANLDFYWCLFWALLYLYCVAIHYPSYCNTKTFRVDTLFILLKNIAFWGPWQHLLWVPWGSQLR